jgi:hypothetical protein
MRLLSHCSKNGANRDGQPLYRSRHHFECAISAGQGAGCSCGGCGGLFAASDCCRLLRSTSHRFRTKFLTHADSDGLAEFLAHTDSGRFAHAGLYPNPQRDSYTDSEVPDENHSQPDSHSNSDRHSDTHAIVSRPEYHPNAYANSTAFGCLAGRSDGCPSKSFSTLFLKRSSSYVLSHNEAALNAHCFSSLATDAKLTCNLAEHLDHLPKRKVSARFTCAVCLSSVATPRPVFRIYSFFNV